MRSSSLAAAPVAASPIYDTLSSGSNGIAFADLVELLTAWGSCGG